MAVVVSRTASGQVPKASLSSNPRRLNSKARGHKYPNDLSDLGLRTLEWLSALKWNLLAATAHRLARSCGNLRGNICRTLMWQDGKTDPHSVVSETKALQRCGRLRGEQW